jgi:hypothetical protein
MVKKYTGQVSISVKMENTIRPFEGTMTIFEAARCGGGRVAEAAVAPV